ncbi:MAG: hypothetical protein ACD_79C00473G0004 [uncultured bacterium]|nr:MAG: hypothetical protein ACD_79C00473G0004 [uncultured bacterium]
MKTTGNIFSGLFDSHAHLCDGQFDSDRDELIGKLTENGIEYVVNVADNLDSSYQCLKLANKYQNIFATAGFHPHNASQFQDNYLKEFVELLKNEKIVAVGEIGLDYHYNFSPKEMQITVFKEMLKLALESEKPFIIHNRKSEEDLIPVLKETGKSSFSGIIHCFDSNEENLKIFLDLGFYISFSGMITFKKSDEIRKMVAYVPLDKLLIETDCPYLAPDPKRGKRNEPALLKYVAMKVSEIRNCSYEDIVLQTKQNACSCYGISNK